MSESTPMWLQLQSRFIDENFDNVVRYLKDESILQDAFYQETLRLLQQRVEEAVQEILAIPVHKYEAPACDDEKAAHHFRFRLFVTFLCSNSKHPLYRTVMAAMLYELSVLVPGQTEQLCRLMMDVLTMEDATSLPVYWEHVNGDLLKTAMHFTAAARPKKPFTAMVDTPVGAVCFHGGKMYVSPNAAEMKRALDEKSSPSLMHLTDRLLLLADKSHRLKTTDLHNYDKIDEFVYDFCKRISAPEKKTKTLKRYADDDVMRVKVLNIKGLKVTVCTCDPEYVKLEGTIDFSPLNNLTRDYTPQNFIAQMHVGDEMTAYYHESKSGNSFDIVTAFEDLQLDELEQVSDDDSFFATAAGIFDDKVRWLTEEGYVIFTYNTHSVFEGDCAVISYSYFDDKIGRCLGKI